jgi:hypothetical protein
LPAGGRAGRQRFSVRIFKAQGPLSSPLRDE